MAVVDSLPQMASDTVLIVVHDTVRVAKAVGVGWDLEKVLTLVGLIVIPLVAAWVGAKQGAERAQKVAMTLHDKTIAADKSARDDERHANAAERETARNTDRDERRDQMVARVRRILTRVIALGTDVPENSDFLALGKRGAEMRILWRSFERQSGDLYLVGTEAFRFELEAFIGKLQTTVAATEAALGEHEARRLSAMVGAPGRGSLPDNEATANNSKDILDAFRTSLTEHKTQAQALLATLSATDAPAEPPSGEHS